MLAALATSTAQALNPSSWSNRQTVIVALPGLARIELPPATLDAARPALEDLRLTDPSGRETPYLLTRADAQAGADPVAAAAGTPEVRPLPVRIVGREEFDGESVLTLDLGAAHLPLASLEFATPAAALECTATVAVRELRNGIVVERTLATGGLHRGPEGARFDMPPATVAPTRELLVHLVTGDGTPLALDAVQAQRRPVWLTFRATVPGTWTLLTGHARVATPRYDTTRLLSSPINAPVTTLAVGPLEGVPRRTESGPSPAHHADDTPVDVSSWRLHKPVLTTAAGVQQLELDADVLAHAQPSLADLRLVSAGRQVPYLIEHSSLSRALPVSLVPVGPVPELPGWSRWEIRLPRTGLPLHRLTFDSEAPLSGRRMRLYERLAGPAGGVYEHTLAEAGSAALSGRPATTVLTLFGPPQSPALIFEIEDATGAPLELHNPRAAYPVVRLLFVASGAPLDLYYGNPLAGPPRHDLALIAPQLLAAEKHDAKLGGETTERAARGGRTLFAGLRASWLLWSALGTVVVVLLVVVKLLPKPPEKPEA